MDEFNEKSGASSEKPPRHSLKEFLQQNLEDLQGMILEQRVFLAEEQNPEHEHHVSWLTTAGILFAQEAAEFALQDRLSNLHFLSDEQVFELIPELEDEMLEDETLDDIDLIAEEFDLPQDHYHNHSKYFEYIEEDLWQDVRNYCMDTDRQLDFIGQYKIALNAQNYSKFDSIVAQEISNISDLIGVDFDEQNDGAGSYRSVDEGLNHVIDHVNFMRADLTRHLNTFKDEMVKNGDASEIAGQYIVGSALIGAIINFQDVVEKGEVEYVEDEDLQSYFPELSDEAFEALNWDKVIERLFPLNKCPANPEALGYVTRAFMASVTDLFQDPELIVQKKQEVQEMLSIPQELDLDGFINGLNEGYKKFDRFGLVDADGNDIDPPADDPDMPDHIEGFFQALKDKLDRTNQSLMQSAEALKQDQKEMSRLAGEHAVVTEFLQVLASYLDDVEFLKAEEDISTFFPELDDEAVGDLEWSKIVDRLDDYARCPANPEAFPALYTKLIGEMEEMFGHDDEHFKKINQLGADSDMQIERVFQFDNEFLKDVKKRSQEIFGVEIDDVIFKGSIIDMIDQFQNPPPLNQEQPELSEKEEEYMQGIENVVREAFADVAVPSENNSANDNPAFVDFRFQDEGDLTLREKLREEISKTLLKIEGYTKSEKESIFLIISTWSEDLGHVAASNFIIGELSHALKKRAEIYGEEMSQGEYVAFLIKCANDAAEKLSDLSLLEELRDNLDGLYKFPEGLSADVIDMDYFTIGSGEAIGFLETELANESEINEQNYGNDNDNNNKYDPDASNLDLWDFGGPSLN